MMTKITSAILTVGALTIGAAIGLGIGKLVSKGINTVVDEINKRRVSSVSLKKEEP